MSPGFIQFLRGFNKAYIRERGREGGGAYNRTKKVFYIKLHSSASQNNFLNSIETNVVKSNPFQYMLQGGKLFWGGWNECYFFRRHSLTFHEGDFARSA